MQKKSLLTFGKAFAYCMVLVTIFFLSPLLAGIIFVVALAIAGQDQAQIEQLFADNLLAIVAISIASGAVTMFLLRFALRMEGLSFKKGLLLDRRPTKQHLKDVGIIYALYFSLTIIVNVALSLTNVVNVDQEQDLGVAAPETALAYIGVFVLFVVVAPIVEEIIFRGYLFNRLRSVVSIPASYVITSVIFGAAHLEFSNLNWIAAIDTLLLSGFLIYLVQKHQSLYSAILLHALKNGVAFTLLYVVA